eukprot:PhM_4_TR17580/c0_g1_i1/m.14196
MVSTIHFSNASSVKGMNLALDFFAWASNRGAVLSPSLAIGRRGNGLRGLYIRRPVQRGELMVSVPRKMWITPSCYDNTMTTTTSAVDGTTSTRLLIPSEAEIEKHVQIDKDMRPAIPAMRMSLYIMTEILKDERSDLETWLNLLEDEDWNDEQIIKEYQGVLDQWDMQHYEELRNQFSRTTTRFYEYIAESREDLLGGRESKITGEAFRRTYRIVTSRVIHEPQPTQPSLIKKFIYTKLYRDWYQQELSRRIFMCPVVDLINHSNTPNVFVRANRTTGDLEVRMLKTIENPPVELCCFYAMPPDRAVSLLRYGFLPHTLQVTEGTDSFDEYYERQARPRMVKRTEQELEEAMEIEREVQRLIKVFKGTDTDDAEEAPAKQEVKQQVKDEVKEEAPKKD